jgi:Fic family protein
MLDQASRAAATLAGAGETLPNPHLLIRPFLRREAVSSSKIEGTQTTISDLFLYEATAQQRDGKGDAREVSNYVRALEHGLARLPELPLSLRLFNEMHAILIDGVRGQDRRPGSLRSEQVWIGQEGTPIGEARFVPAPPDQIRDLMSDLERFLNEPSELPPLVRCALAHYQFETIHPYFDGNGRLGRLLITLVLCEQRVLSQPLLYLSAFFERNRDRYYDALMNVSATGDWAPWLQFFFAGVQEQARDALLRSRRLRRLEDEYRKRLQQQHASANALRLADMLFEAPFITPARAADALGVTYAGARKVLDKLAEHGIVAPLPGTGPMVYVARAILEAIDSPITSEAE